MRSAYAGFSLKPGALPYGRGKTGGFDLRRALLL
jgi:hypothetical protein